MIIFRLIINNIYIKLLIMKFYRVLALGITMLLAFTAKAEQKTFVREYNYQASEDDSKLTARSKALTAVKSLLIEELGVYIESYVNYSLEEKNSKIVNDFFVREIRQVSAGIAETKILEEQWTGSNYYVKAEIKADPDEVIRTLNKTIEQQKSNVVIDSLQILLSDSQKDLGTKNQQIEELKKTLEEKETAVKTQQAKVLALQKQLNELNALLEKNKADEAKAESEIERIRSILTQKTQTAQSKVKIGMIASEVKSLCGSPRSVDGYEQGGDFAYNYGYIWIIFNNGIATYAVYAEEYDTTYADMYIIDKITNKITR